MLPADGLVRESDTPQAAGPGWRVRVANALWNAICDFREELLRRRRGSK
jgi:hypothetical protein